MTDSCNYASLKRSEIVEMIVSSLQDVLDTATETPDVEELGEETRLLGRQGLLDSMGLVNLIVDVEQRLEEERDVILVLADERAMSQKRSPFRSVGSLADYVCQLTGEQV